VTNTNRDDASRDGLRGVYVEKSVASVINELTRSNQEQG
jgi:hypothetical protein